MKNHDKASLPKIQIKQVQVLNRILVNNGIKSNHSAGVNAMMGGTTTVDTVTTSVSGVF
jgi:hypothetical protein